MESELIVTRGGVEKTVARGPFYPVGDPDYWIALLARLPMPWDSFRVTSAGNPVCGALRAP